MATSETYTQAVADVTRNRTNEILDAVCREDNSLHIFLVVSKGGDGKTHLLRQVRSRLGDIPAAIGSELIDLYHSHLNSSSGLSDAIAESFAATQVFHAYHQARATIEERRKKGLIGKDFEVYQQACDTAFQRGFDELAAERRIVLFLDTAERMRYEMDYVQQYCRLSIEGTTVKEWLLNHLKRSHNAVCIIAGRPEIREYLETDLQQMNNAGAHVFFHPVQLGGFSHSEVQDFYAQSTDLYDALDEGELDANIQDQLWDATQGNPIRLNLALEVLSSGLQLDPLLDQIRQGNRDEITANIDRILVESIFESDRDEDKRNTLRNLVFARRGLTASLLQTLEPTLSLAECQRRLEDAGRRAYVKVYAGRRQADAEVRYFLHDELYQLCDTYMDIPLDDLQAASQRIVAYCEAEIAAASSSVARQDRLVDSLIYRLRAAPQAGYEWFVQQNDMAIRAAEEQLDMRLHNEMLAFLRSPSPLDKQLIELNPDLPARFNCDTGAGWVKRLMIRGRNKEAIRVYEELLAAKENPCAYGSPDGMLARADLLVYAAQAMIYASEKMRAVPILHEVLKRLETAVKQLNENRARLWAWRVQLVAGRAENDLGYTYWMNDGRFNEALEHFTRALQYFRPVSTLQEEYANVLDNMGRVYALVRQQAAAEKCVEEGLAIRTRLGRDYRVALSLNSRAIVHLEFDQPQRGLLRVQEALTIFRHLGAKRGVGLALITAGRIKRVLANPANQTVNAERQKLLEDAQTDLEEAQRIFQKEVHEPVRLVDAQNELGAVYRDRAQILREEGMEYAGFTTKALDQLRKSIQLADAHGLTHQAADSYEDMAQTLAVQEEWEAALDALARAEGYVPAQYRLAPSNARGHWVEEQEYDLFLALLGKIEYLRGRIAFQQCAAEPSGRRPVAALRPMLTHYLLSTLYLQAYYGQRENDRLRLMENQIYADFKHYSDAEVHDLKAMLLDVGREYGMQAVRVNQFFDATIGFLRIPT